MDILRWRMWLGQHKVHFFLLESMVWKTSDPMGYLGDNKGRTECKHEGSLLANSSTWWIFPKYSVETFFWMQDSH